MENQEKVEKSGSAVGPPNRMFPYLLKAKNKPATTKILVLRIKNQPKESDAICWKALNISMMVSLKKKEMNMMIQNKNKMQQTERSESEIVSETHFTDPKFNSNETNS